MLDSGYYFVNYHGTFVPVLLTNINGKMFHYKVASKEWEEINIQRIGGKL